MATSTGDVFIAENNNAEIAITDGVHIYVYNYLTLVYTIATVPAALTNPGYISFQNGRLLVANTGTTNWYLSASNNALSWPNDSAHIGALQSKPDTIQAAVPTPGGGNNLFLFGHNVVEQWQDVGNALFPYQRSSTFNVDYGTFNASSIAAMDDYVVWISGNEQSGAALMVIEGGRANKISTDGIDFKLANLTNPTNCTGFLFRQDGHVIYQFTFPDDNLSYAYDFNTKMFFTVTDENLNYHIARDVVFLNNNYYFVSFNGGNLYDFGTEYTDADYGDGQVYELPRIRVCPPIRLPSQRMFILKSAGFTVENGQPNTITTIPASSSDLATEDLMDITTEGGVFLETEHNVGAVSAYTIASEAIDISISRDGGETFGNSWRKEMRPTGIRRSRVIWQRLGQANDATMMYRFSGFGRFVVVDDGVCEVYQ